MPAEYPPDTKYPSPELSAMVQRELERQIKASVSLNMKQKKPKEVADRVFFAGLLIWLSWLAVNIMAGLEIGTDRAYFTFNPDANFIATLGYMAIAAASVVTGTAVADKIKNSPTNDKGQS